MGFEINHSSQKPVIREAASTRDGGAGNLGYFEQGHGEKKHKEEENIFSHEENHSDSFIHESDIDKEIEESFSFSKLIAEIIFSVREWFRKLIR